MSDGTKYAASEIMSATDETDKPSEAPFVLPNRLRFVRSLALVSGAAVGIAAGAVVFGSGCGQSCAGICGFYPGVQPAIDAHYERPVDHPVVQEAGESHDGPADAGAEKPPSDGHVGGGPGPAPHLPADWLA